MMFNIVVFGLCLARCLAENFNYAAAPYATTGGSTFSGSAPYSSEWTMPTASAGSNGFKMAMGAPKSRQFSFQPSTFYSQLNYQPSSETVPNYRVSNGFAKSGASVYSAGGGYTGYQGSIAQVAQPAWGQHSFQGGVQPAWNQHALQGGEYSIGAGKTAYTTGVLPYSGQSAVAQVAQPGFAKFYSGQEAGYPTVTADGFLKDTPEVLEAKKAHLAEKMRIAKYMGNSDSQYSYAGSTPETGKAFTSSYYTPTAEGMATTSPETYQSAPAAYSHTVGRKKRDISCDGPTFHALPPHPFELPHPATLALAHSLPTFHHAAPAFHHAAPTFYHAAPTFHHAGPTFYHAAPTFHHIAPTFHHATPTFHHATVIDHTLAEGPSC